tara:strand:+ start:616 stop:1299 length:684 start_codon:yes stop_codon:yes gene_type:complete
MATKLSAVTQKTGTNADDLIYLASTEDSGNSYASKAIKISNLFSSVASGTDLGTFSGSTISDNASVQGALQELETALEAEGVNRAAAITAAVDALVDSAPGTLDTLNEIAAAINDDSNAFTTLTSAIAAVQADVDQNESDSDAALAAQHTALLAAVAAVQADVNQNESDADSAIAALDAKTVDGGDNVNNLVASTTPDTTPATFYFLAVDASTGAIKVVDKNFVEVE